MKHITVSVPDHDYRECLNPRSIVFYLISDPKVRLVRPDEEPLRTVRTYEFLIPERLGYQFPGE